MPYAEAKGARIYYEEAGSGTPILFLHEFAGDHRSWLDQMRYFARGYRCITMGARGYPPSDVPETDGAYGQDTANRDAIAVLDHLRIDKAHVVGLSMGAYTALQLAIHFPARIRSIVPAGGGSGSAPGAREQFVRDALARAADMLASGKVPGDKLGMGPTRIQLFNKDPLGWRIASGHQSDHPGLGSAMVLRNVQARRPSLYELEAGLRGVTAPTLLIVGDEDEPCLDVNLWMKRLMPAATLAIVPGTGHVVNHEEPALFNLLVERFLAAVDRGSWRPRDPRAYAGAAGALGFCMKA